LNHIKSVCVYCGSSSKAGDLFKESAADLGKILAENNVRVVFGGGHVGLMGIVSDAALNHGGEVIGIIPHHIADKEIAHNNLTELHLVQSMHERKQMMVDRSDAFIILPGGLGTMDEFFEIFTWWQLGLHDKPIIIINVEGYWTPLLDLLKNIVKHQFARPEDLEHLAFIDKVEDIMLALSQSPKESIDAQTKWM